MSSKKQLRLSYLNLLEHYPQQKRDEDSQYIYTHLFASTEWKVAEIVGITVSRFPEIDTRPIIEQAWLEDKQVVVPKCVPNDKTMTYYSLTDYDQLETVYAGLLEPIQSISKSVNKDFINLLVVPGVAYTKKGYRVGYGGGYFDRFLSDYNGHTVSVAFTEQLTENFTIDVFDLPVHRLITEKGIIECG